MLNRDTRRASSAAKQRVVIVFVRAPRHKTHQAAPGPVSPPSLLGACASFVGLPKQSDRIIAPMVIDISGVRLMP
jgi:hypothetical protein